MKLSNEDVQQILQLLDASPVNELHLETDRFKLTLRRGDGQWTQSTEVVSKPNLLVPSKPAAPVAAAAPATEKARASTKASKGLVEVLAPLPGTFYRSPQPGAPPFVEIGSAVEEHTVVCIVETMKLMNSVHAGARGIVREICQQSGQPTDQDAVLMRIEPQRP